jgi:thiosulfate dehydrogenase
MIIRTLTVKVNIIIAGLFIGVAACSQDDKKPETAIAAKDTTKLFTPPDTSTIPHDEFGDMVRYGRDLVLNTAYYLGPDGTVGQFLGNKMNCASCHREAGTIPYGLNFFSAHARYPQYRGRENRILTLAERVNNCIERPHNGTPMPLDSKEMIAIVSYMKWLAKDVPVGHHVPGDNSVELEYMDRPASSENGARIYAQHCASCHGANGEGVFTADSVTYIYPPLWGKYGYERGSSMHRVLKAARFIKANMPKDKATWDKPFLTDAEAMDVAAFINDDAIHYRPNKNETTVSYPNIKVKPIDYDEGPYPDTFSAMRHKFGPFKQIIDYHKEKGLPVVF